MNKEKHMFEGDERLQESSHGQKNAEENQNREDYGETELDYWRVKDTMFTIVKNTKTMKKECCFIAIGSSKATELISEDEAVRMIKEKDWKLIEMMAICIADYNYSKREKENTEELKKLMEEQKVK